MRHSSVAAQPPLKTRNWNAPESLIEKLMFGLPPEKLIWYQSEVAPKIVRVSDEALPPEPIVPSEVGAAQLEAAAPAIAQPQVPALHTELTAHAFGQVPQWFGSVFRFVSQPSLVIPLQFANPGLQLRIAQLPAPHVGVALGNAHARPQPPQFVKVFNCVSQPSAGIALQSPKPETQPNAQALEAQ